MSAVKENSTKGGISHSNWEAPQHTDGGQGSKVKEWESSLPSAPSISLPKGGGAIKGVGEKFSTNTLTGSGSLTVPISTSPGRSGFGPQLGLSYSSGQGNGPFGLGWSLFLPSISRKTDKGIPLYDDANESDTFVLSGSEDLVPFREPDGGLFADRSTVPGYTIRRYQPRVEGLFARIERWMRDDGDIHWRSISKDNILTVYGKDSDSRITDPRNKQRVFSWLICETRDDRGNAIIYGYKPEDGANVDLGQAHEQHRGRREDKQRAANQYPKRIRYGNRRPLLTSEGQRPRWVATADIEATAWMFEIILDYGEHHRTDPKPNDAGSWYCRRDPFSSYRSGFEIRTYRLCQRVLMFHHFPDETDVGANCLVKSTDFRFEEDPHAGDVTLSRLSSVIQNSYRRGTASSYIQRSLPPLVFSYSQAQLHGQVHTVDAASMNNLPVGLDGSLYRLVDLDGEGVSGILTQQGGGWFYKRNLSPLSQRAQFGPTECLPTIPVANSEENNQDTQFLDLAGDGNLDLVQLGAGVKGFYERDHAGWASFRAFSSCPNINSRDPNLRFVDVTGDGLADILLTEDRAITWFPSLGEAGFDNAIQVGLAGDETQGPRLLFGDTTQSIYLSDMSGDGLTDLVRIRNGDICYWPNLGYGRFGAQVTMDNAPWMDSVDCFDQRHIRLADIDGSGMTDLIYLGGQGIDIYLNQAGNSWSKKRRLPSAPPIDNAASVQAIDLLGNGTACLVWSSPLPMTSSPLQYIDLMGGQKAHLMTKVTNNLGIRLAIEYAPSTRFYLEDKAEGKPWVTKLPFVVFVVSRVATEDLVSRNRFVTRYRYHHGYFDGSEREFRGFGMVEQWDTESIGAISFSTTQGDTNFDESSYVPPVLTRSWFHTGAFMDQTVISSQFQDEYFLEGTSGGTGMLLADTLLPDTILRPDGTRTVYPLTAQERQEACRALKGSLLRQEVYSLDGTEEAGRPFTASERNFTVELLQPRGENQHAVFFAHPREQVDIQYERKAWDTASGQELMDPRIQHSLVLRVDGFGNVLRSISINYRRRPFSFATVSEQERTHLLLTINRYANRSTEPEWQRVGLLVEAMRYEIVNPPTPGITGNRVDLFPFDQMDTMAEALFPFGTRSPDPTALWPYGKWDWRLNPSDAPNGPRLRLIDNERTLYRKDNLSGPHALGEIDSRGLPYETYKLAFPVGLATQVYVDSNRLQATELQDVLTRGKYTQLDNDGNWWIPSGKVFFSPERRDPPDAELAYAQQHFFLPRRYRDAFDDEVVSTESTVRYDGYDLLVAETEDPLGNKVTVGERSASGELIDVTKSGHDYRTLLPRLVTDVNGNRVETLSDTLGQIVGTAVMGKSGESFGDSLENFEVDIAPSELDGFYSSSDPHTLAKDLLNGASTRIIYDIDRFWRSQQAYPDNPEEWQPAYTVLLARETHLNDPEPPQGLQIQIGWVYSDGLGREIQKKTQAEPGLIDGDGQPTDPRWVGSGWTIYNNKGQPVRQYEPFFSRNHRFEFGAEVGVSSIRLYDPLNRVVATLHPNHTYEKTVFDAWQQSIYDLNDNVLVAEPNHDPHVGHLFRRLPPAAVVPTWYTQRESGLLGLPEQQAARKTAVHADTPTVVLLDSLGLAFRKVDHDKRQYTDAPQGNPPVEEQLYQTETVFDVEGRPRGILDAHGRLVMRYEYDMLGNIVHRASMEAGERWALTDMTGNVFYQWNTRGYQYHTLYDQLRRPTKSYCRDPSGLDFLDRLIEYGENEPTAEARNQRGKAVRVFDQAGVVETKAYDFKGNVLHSQRRFAQDYKQALDWSVVVPLHTAAHDRVVTYDAINRPSRTTMPDKSVISTVYNRSNHVNGVQLHLHGGVASTPLVVKIDYNARGQREQVTYGNGVRTIFEYDSLTFRLIRLISRRDAANFPDDCPNPPAVGWPGCQIQSLRYTYDPVGNVTHISDDSQQAIYFRNKRVDPSNDYTYSAVYQLLEATGREHLGQTGGQLNGPTAPNAMMNRINHSNDGNAMGQYLEKYNYDAVGNIQSMQHVGSNPTNPGWTRHYAYNEPSLLEAEKPSNRLSTTRIGSSLETYRYDQEGGLHGNMTSMPHLSLMRWDHRDQLRVSAQQVVNNGGTPETTWYVYDAMGQRVRKVTERQSATGGTPTLLKERIYMDGFELFRKYGQDTNAITTECETLRIMDGPQAIAIVETKTQGSDPVPSQRIRYQLTNHLNSVILELDDQAQIISYEEYTPFGAPTYRAVRDQTEAPKRYGFTGKELDRESGFSYHGARYYAPWIGRWIACDPVGIKDGLNTYSYVRNNPVNFHDPGGTEGEPSSKDKKWELPETFNLTDKPIQLNGHWVRAQYIPGTSGKTILIVGGIHQDEPQGRALSDAVLAAVQKIDRPYYNILIVPNLYEDRRTNSRDIAGTGTNRNYPKEGKTLAQSTKRGQLRDANGKPMLDETVILVALIEKFKPQLALQIHDKRWYHDRDVIKEGAAGVFVDPKKGGEETADFMTNAMAVAARDAGLDPKGLRGNFITPNMAQLSNKKHHDVPTEWLKEGTFRTRYPNDTAKTPIPGVTFGVYGSSVGMDVYLIEADKTNTNPANTDIWAQVVVSTLLTDPQTVASRALLRGLNKMWQDFRQSIDQVKW